MNIKLFQLNQVSYFFCNILWSGNNFGYNCNLKTFHDLFPYIYIRLEGRAWLTLTNVYEILIVPIQIM